MDPLLRLTVGFLLASSLCACAKTVRFNTKDSENRSFEVTCPTPNDCEVKSGTLANPTATKPDGARPGFALHLASRLFAVCDVWMQGAKSFSIQMADCRPLACTSDRECPAARGLSHGTCANSMCIEPSGAITPDDAALLCLAGTGTPSSSTHQVERYALGSNCGYPCKVPTVCRQP